MVIPILKKKDPKQCTDYRRISLLSLPEKVYQYAKSLEKKCREKRIQNWIMVTGQCGLRPGRSITDQIFTLKQIFEKSWEYGKELDALLILKKHMTEFLGISGGHSDASSAATFSVVVATAPLFF